MSEPLESTAFSKNILKKVSYTHDGMIDLILANPAISQIALADHFGVSKQWVSRLLCSDAFQARLAVRKADLVDPSLMMGIEEKFKAMAHKSLDIIFEKLDQTKSVDMAFKGLTIAQKALGLGARPENVSLQQNFVVQMPGQAKSSSAWAEEYSGAKSAALTPQMVTDATEKQRNPLVPHVADVQHPSPTAILGSETSSMSDGTPFLMPKVA